MKKVGMVWAASLLTAGFAGLLLVLWALGMELPDFAVRLLGIAELIALPALAYSTVRRLMEKKGERR